MLPLPNEESPEALADWLEASLLTSDFPVRVADAEITDVLEEAGRDKDEGLEQILQVTRQRAQLPANNYPVERAGQGFRLRGPWTDYLCYSFLLFVSLNQYYASLRYVRGSAGIPAKLFEHVTARAIAAFIGGSRVIRIGAPREPPVPSSFPAAIDYLVDVINEPAGARDLEYQSSGDDGLDLWGFKTFSDNRPGQLAVLAQCAIGTDWATKRSELDLSVWGRHVSWFSQPLKAFAVPFQIAAGSWRETATRGGIVLDRLRIADLVVHGDLSNAHAVGMRAWTTRRRSQATQLS